MKTSRYVAYAGPHLHSLTVSDVCHKCYALYVEAREKGDKEFLASDINRQKTMHTLKKINEKIGKDTLIPGSAKYQIIKVKARSCPICENCGSKKFSILSRSENEIVLQCLACRRLSSV